MTRSVLTSLLSLPVRHLPREAEVENLDVSVARDEEVIWFQVAMNDSPGMGRAQSVGDLAAIVHGSLRGERTCLERLPERLPVEQLHHGKLQPVGTVQDRRWRGCSDGTAPQSALSLTLEASEGVGIGRHSRGQDLDRDVAVQLRVVSLEHLAHAAGADRRDDLVRTENGSWDQCHEVTAL